MKSLFERMRESLRPKPDLPDGLFMLDGKVMFDCRVCGQPSEWPADPEDFDLANPHNVCGGSPRCCP